MIINLIFTICGVSTLFHMNVDMNGAYPKCNCSVIYLRSEKLKKLENLNN